MKASRALPVLAALLLLGGCARVIDDTVAGAISKPATEVRARTGDRDRADRLAEQVRESIARFRDVEAAEAAGYRSFPPEPGPTDRMIHYVNRDLSQREVKRIDTTRPGALLYERDGEGGLRLVGAVQHGAELLLLARHPAPGNAPQPPSPDSTLRMRKNRGRNMGAVSKTATMIAKNTPIEPNAPAIP